MRSLLAFLFLVGCVSNKTATYERKELVSWELRPRPGYKGLTSNRCIKYSGEKCVERDLVEFDLNKDEDRLRLHAARFVCRVSDAPSPIYRICKELHGLCQQTVVSSGFLGLRKEIRLVDFIDINQRYQYLIDKGAYCVSLDAGGEDV